jgi:hypothetical protein
MTTFEFDRQLVPIGASQQFWADKRIDLNGRTSLTRPGLADRAVAGDLDNDGDVDAIVHLFPLVDLIPGSNPATYRTPLITNLAGYAGSIAQHSSGWRYLENITTGPNPPGYWFRDVAPTRMVDQPVGGTFSALWNRGRGMDVLADFDNNGALDLYTTNAQEGPGPDPLRRRAADVRPALPERRRRRADRHARGRQRRLRAAGAAPRRQHAEGRRFVRLRAGRHRQRRRRRRLRDPRRPTSGRVPELYVNGPNGASISFKDEYSDHPGVSGRVPTLTTALSNQVHSALQGANETSTRPSAVLLRLRRGRRPRTSSSPSTTTCRASTGTSART